MNKNKYLNGVLPMFLINFSIGAVYCWTLFKGYVIDYTGFDKSVTEWCFSLAILFLGLTAAFGGKIVEKSVKVSSWITLITFTSGWLLTGFGIQIKNPFLTILGFGVIQGIGLGFGYLTPVKTLMIWFDKRKGFAAALAITGFGLAAVIANPIIAGLLETIPVYTVFYILAGIYGIAILFATLLIHRPETTEANKKVFTNVFNIIFTKKFILLWLIVFINISCGLALISQERQIFGILGMDNISLIVLFCSINAIGNLLGRLIMASLQDRLNNKHIPYYYMAIFSVIACAIGFLFSTNVSIIVIVIFIIQFFFGCGFSCLPNIIHQSYGIKQLATIHGLVLSAWGIAGLFGNQFASFIIHRFELNILYLALTILFCIELTILLIWVKLKNK